MMKLLISALALNSVLAKRLEIPDIHQNIPVVSNWSPRSHAFDVDLDDTAIAVNFVSRLNPDYSFVVKNDYVSKHNGVRHIYFRQTVNGLEVMNGDINVNIDGGKVISFGNSFYNNQIQQDLFFGFQAPLSPSDAFRSLSKTIGLENQLQEIQIVEQSEKLTGSLGSLDSNCKLRNIPFVTEDVSASLSFFQTNDGKSIHLAWNFVANMEENTLNAFVSAASGEVLEIVDWVSDASKYRVLPLGVNDPADGERLMQEENEVFPEASPVGWHTDGKVTYNSTRGNNVAAQNNPNGRDSWEKNYRPTPLNGTSYDFPVDFTKEAKTYEDASIANLFFWNNLIHDFCYVYGFDEKSGNFQDNNFGKGGKGGDSVIANAQDGSGTNNANFMTPPDGQHGKMRMYTWTQSRPGRDGDLDNGIIIHEYFHGVSNRLTGGPANVNCLGSGEAGGMGEGWGDFFGVAMRQRVTHTRSSVFAMGNYSMNNKNGVRRYPYSTDMSVNPSTYGFTKKRGYEGVHAKGEVWAAILMECYWNMVDAHGFDAKLTPGSKGNGMVLQDVMDGFKLQPCRPNFVSARDAILQADKVNYGGRNLCLLWKGFAKRGLGAKATAGGNEDFSLPAECVESNDMRSRTFSFNFN